ncbi:MAG: sulfatase [Spirochaetota bacterium]
MLTPAKYQPNIVFILTDQQRYDTIAALGFDYMETPNLDRLATEGVSFDRCYITAPSCVPSRASLFQGYYPHTTGVYKNGDRWTTSWVSDLADAGYRCVNVGKMHTVPLATPAGFHERYVVENKDRFLEGRYFFDEWDKALRARGIVKQQRELYRRRDDYDRRLGAFAWELDEDMQSDNFVGGFAKWWLDTYPIDQPLFMQVGFPGPHPPYDPTPRWLERYENKDLPLRDFSRQEIDAQPKPLRELRQHMLDVDHDSVVHLSEPTRAQRHFQRACYLANVSMIDEQVGAIMSALGASGLLDDTVIVFASDHGDSLGDHGHSQKWSMYEETVRVPAIVWMGDRVRVELAADEAKRGRRVDSLVSLFDLGPTMLALAGVTPQEDMEAVSLTPLIGLGRRSGRARPHGSAASTRDDDGNDSTRDPVEGRAGGSTRDVAGESAVRPADHAVAVSDASWDVPATRPVFVNEDGSRRYVFAEHGRDNILAGTDVMTMIRDERWKLVTYSGHEDGQLFDLEEDPDERINLWESGDASSHRRRLLDALHEWYRESLYQTRARRRR